MENKLPVLKRSGSFVGSRDDKRFVKYMWNIEYPKHTVVDIDRCYNLFQLVNSCIDIYSDMTEVGVFKGGTAKLILKCLSKTKKKLHLFDTFEGMPETDPKKDYHKNGDGCNTSVKEVKEFLKPFKNFEINKGIFPQSIPDDWEYKRFSFVHVDADIYKSIKDCCEYFYPRLNVGGIMLFDDYGFFTCPGAKEAVDEYFDNWKYSSRLFYLQGGQCYVTKIRE